MSSPASAAIDAARPVYIESESKKVGNLAVPGSLIEAMRASPCLRLELADDQRVALLLEDYAFFVSDPELFCERLDALVTLRGREVVALWQAQVRSGDVISVKQGSREKEYFKVVAEVLRTRTAPAWLALEPENLTGRVVTEPARDQIDMPPINEQLIIEFYSR